MSDNSKKTLCSLCLSTDRKLSKLCWIPDGINLLYMLLTHDPEAYKEGFFKDRAGLLVCWECGAMIYRIKRFQMQSCVAQLRLASIVDSRSNVKLQTLSRLSTTHNTTPHYDFQSNDITENFIDCGPAKEIKTERSDSDSDDVPLSLYFHENDSDSYEPVNYKIESVNSNIKADNSIETGNNNCPLGYSTIKSDNRIEISNSNYDSGNSNFEPGYSNFKPGYSNFKPGYSNIKPGKSNCEPGKDTQPDEFDNTKHKLDNSVCLDAKLSENVQINDTKETSKKKTKIKYSKYFSIQIMSEKEMLEIMEKRRIDLNKESVLKCDNCIVRFKTDDELLSHNLSLHSKNDNLSKCDICHIYTDLPTHRQTHYHRYNCMLCTHIAYTHIEIIGHLKRRHKDICCGKRKVSKRKNGQSEDIPKFPCPECNISFQNKDLRYKHVQKVHREGYKCGYCDKKFAFKNNLKRHERSHQSPLPREECPSCHKMIRVDLVKSHSRIHTDRQKFVCVECDKSFVSRETYESHLKYARAHATVEVCRHKCPLCHKRYRSRLELSDHINYRHKGRTEHKCPVCGKGLATKRCIRRHVRRAHEGIKESAKDKICQQCGKAFRDKKGLTEHERVHTGARPLACAACGRAFRQRAALYAHTRRVHKGGGR